VKLRRVALANLRRKKSASSGISSLRSRSGGGVMATT
jgi:hypothetical protein